MAASAIENKNLRTQRSVSHAGFLSTAINTDEEGHLKIIPETGSSCSPSASTSILNDSGSSGGSKQHHQFDENPLSFHPLKSYKTGNIGESNLSMMTEIGPVFTTNSPTKRAKEFSHLYNRSSLLDSKPIRASKSTLDLPNLTEQEFAQGGEGERSNDNKQLFLYVRTDFTTQESVSEPETKRRHKSATSTTSPNISPQNVADFDYRQTLNNKSSGVYNGINNNNIEDVQEKPKKRRSFKLKSKSNNKENKEKDKGAGSPISPGNVKVCGTEIGPAIAVGLNIGSSIVTSNGIPIGTEQLLVKDSNIVPLPVSVLPMTVEPSDSSDTEAVDSDLRPEIASIVVPLPSPDLETVDLSESAIPIVPPVCPVDHTIGKEMLNAVIPCGIDQLFTMLFTSSKFYLDFQTSRKTFDMNQCEWQLKDGSHKTRQLSFTVLTGQSLGPKTAQVTETQTLLPASRPGLLYAIQSESVNAGIPYADAFSVNCHYCLTRVSPHESNITVISKIHYKKSVWAKSFIEKNSMAALADFFSHLERALKEECAKSIAGNITPISPVVVSSLPRRRHRKKCRAPDIPASAMTRALNLENSSMHSGTLEDGKSRYFTLDRFVDNMNIFTGGTLRSTINTAMPDILSDASSTDVVEGSLVMKIILTVLGCLLLLNAFLYFKLSSLERTANLSVLYPPAVQFSGEAPQTHQEWLMLLQQQETLHRTEVQGWHEILVSAIKILHQAEKDLESLKSHISTYGTGNVIVKPIIPRDTSDLFYSSTKTEKSESELPSPATVTSGKDKTTTQTQPKENLPIDVGGDAIASD